MDMLSVEERSRVMSLVKAKNTKPELRVRRALYSLGYRYRLYCKDLPGKPDIVFRKFKTVVFVHGCFWHRHKNCKKTRMPKSNQMFWKEKFKNNQIRDNKVAQKYSEMGWNVVIVWECETENAQKLDCAIQRIIANLK